MHGNMFIAIAVLNETEQQYKTYMVQNSDLSYIVEIKLWTLFEKVIDWFRYLKLLQVLCYSIPYSVHQY